MTYLKSTTIIALGTALIFAADAHAQSYDGELASPQTNQVKQEKRPDNAMRDNSNSPANLANVDDADITKIKVKAPYDPDRFVPVTALDGTVYYNRFMARDDYQQGQSETEVAERYFIIYDGVRYLNRIVKPAS